MTSITDFKPRENLFIRARNSNKLRKFFEWFCLMKMFQNLQDKERYNQM